MNDYAKASSPSVSIFVGDAWTSHYSRAIERLSCRGAAVNGRPGQVLRLKGRGTALRSRMFAVDDPFNRACRYHGSLKAQSFDLEPFLTIDLTS